MKTTNNKRNKLVTARPAPLVLEARIMFDGAAADTLLMAARPADALVKDAVSVDKSAAAAEARAPAAVIAEAASGAAAVAQRDAAVPLFSIVSTDASLADAAMRAEQLIRDYLQTHPDDASLFAFFNGQQESPSEQWHANAEALRQEILDGRFEIRVIDVSNAEIGGVFGAFAANGPDGQPTIFLNRDWLASGPSPEAVERVLVEEFGHAIDNALNAGRDTAGDEGEAFASALLRFDLSDADRARIAAENDHSTIYVDGHAYEVEEAAITFSGVYQGQPSAWSQEANQIANVTAIAGSRFKFTSADPGAPYFSGNNVAGTLSYVDADGQVRTVDGVISRLFKTNGTVQGLYFYAWGNTTTIGDGGAGGDAAETAYLLVLDPTKFSSGNTYRTSSDPVDTALNKLIVPNSAPVAVNDLATVIEGKAISGNVLANDTDVNNDTLTVTGFKVGTTTGTLGQAQSISGVGTLVVYSDGQYTFTAASGYTGAVPVVSYTVSDGQATASGKLSIAIVPVNDAPLGSSKTVTIKEDYSYTFASSDFGFSDPNDTPANALYSVKVTTLPALGTLTLNGVAVSAGQEILAADIARLKYTPGSDGNGTGYASFTFQVRDNGGTANGGVDTDPTPKTMTFNVTAVNDAPVANPDAANAVEAGGVNNGTAGSNATGNVLDNDTDPDAGDTRLVASASSNAQGATTVATNTGITGVYGTLTISADGSYTYTVDNSNASVQALRQASDTLTDKFTYTVKDAAGLSSSTTLTVTIKGANDAPVAKGDFALAVSSTVTAAKVNPTGNVLTNDTDVDNGDTKTVTQASKGQALSGTPTDIGLGMAVEGVELETFTSIELSQTGIGKVSVGDTISGNGIPSGTTILSKNNSTKVITVSKPVALSINDTFTINSSDSAVVVSLSAKNTTVIAISSASGTITAGMTVTGTGITGGTTVSSVTTTGGYSYVTLSNAYSGTLASNLVFGSTGTAINGDYGTLVLQQNGTYAYTVTSTTLTTGSAPYYDYFTYKVSDAGGLTSTATLKIQIDVSNTAPPTATADTNSITENTASVSTTSGTGVLANDSVSSGGTGKRVSSAWTADASSPTGISSGSNATIAGLYGSLLLNSDGSYTYTLDNSNARVDALKSGQSLSEQFTYRMTDSNGGGANATLTITINGANDAPTAVGDAASAIEAGGVGNASAGYNPTGNVLSNDTDVEKDSLSVSAITGGTLGQAKAGNYGSLTLNGDGSYSYTVDNSNAGVQALNSGQTLTDSFTYTVSDGNGGTATATLTVTINGANDAPANAIPGVSPVVAEGGSTTITGVSVADVDDASLSVQLSVQNGTLSIGNLNGSAITGGADGSGNLTLSGTKAQINSALATLSYAGATQFSGSDRLTVLTTDSGGLTDTSALTITVAPDDRTLSVAGSTVNESSPYAFFTVTGVAGQKLSLSLGSTGSGDGHATSGADFAPGMEYFDGNAWVAYGGGMVDVPGGGTLLVRVAILNDSTYEGAETFKLTAANKAGTTYSASSTIVDDGTGSVFLDSNTTGTPNQTSDSGYPFHLDDDRSLSVNSVNVNEASPYAVFTVSGYSGQVVSLALAGGTATLGVDTGTDIQYYDGAQWQDFDGASVTLGGPTLLVRVGIAQDSVYEGAENFGLVATNLGGGSPALGVATITDDGTGTLFTGTVTAGNPDTAATALDDDRSLTVANPTVNEASDWAIFTISGNAGEQVSLTLHDDSVGGTVSGKANIDATQTLQFWNGSQWESYDASRPPAIQSGNTLLVRVDVTQEHDSIYEGAETFRLSAAYLSGDTSRSATGTATVVDDGTGSRYPGTVTVVTATANNVTTVLSSAADTDTDNLDDDRALAVTSPVVNEASDFTVFTVTGTAGQTATLQLVEGSGAGFADIDEGQTLKIWNGAAWEDYSGSVTFADGSAVLVRVDIRQEQDTSYEGPENFQLKATYTTGDSTRTSSGTASIRDDGTGVIHTGNVENDAPDTATSGLDDDRSLTVSSPTVNEASDYAVFVVAGDAGEVIGLQLLEGSGDGYADIDQTQVLQVWNGAGWDDFNGSIAIPSGGSLLVRVDIRVEQDSVYEGAESFQLKATFANGDTSRSVSGTATIKDDATGTRYPGTVTNGVPDTSTEDLDDDRGQSPSNHAPTASDTSVSTNEDTAKTGSLPTAADVDNDSVTYTKASDPEHGTVVVNGDGSYTYTPTADYHGSDSFTYTVSDGNGGSNTYTVSITVNPVNDAPTASDTSVSTNEDTAKTGSLPTATDVDNDSVTYAKASDPEHGTVVVNGDGSYTYTPTADYHGSDSFTYTVSDGNGGSNTYTVSITVNPVNDAPTASDTSVSTSEDTAKTGSLPTAADVDNDTVTYAKASDPEHGTVVVNEDGSYTYTPTADYHGGDSFTYTVSDGNGGSNTYTVSITVNPVNDAPTASDTSVSTNEDTAKTGSLPTASDADNDTVTYAKASDPGHGTVVVNEDGSYTYTPTADYHGSDSITYTVSDGNGGSNTYTVSITVNPVNDAPIASSVNNANATVGQPLSPLVVPPFSDIDSEILTYSATLADGSELPTWLHFDSATRTFSGSPPPGAAASYVLRVTGSDGELADSVSFTLVVRDPTPPAQTTTILAMTRDSGISATDFVTADGAANRTVSGRISAPLGQNEIVQVSFDGGTTWQTASTNGTNWSAVDSGSHAANWTIMARVSSTVADQAGPVASQAVVYDPVAPATPTVNFVSTTSTTPTLSGTAAVGNGETLTVTVNGATYSVVAGSGVWSLDLAAAAPVAGTLDPLAAGSVYDVTATVTDKAGNTSVDRSSGELNISAPPPAPVPPPVVVVPTAPPPVEAPPPAPVNIPVPEIKVVEVPPSVPGSVVGSDSSRLTNGFGSVKTDASPEFEIRRSAELSDVYTRDGGFRTVVAKADEPALVLFQGVPDQYTESGARISLTVPSDAFAHTQPKEVVRLAATLQDGRPLPAWVQFNGQTGQFSGEVPPGMVGELRIKVMARDTQGREATALFRVNIGVVKGTAGKTGLSEQLRRSGSFALSRDSRMAAPARPADSASGPG